MNIKLRALWSALAVMVTLFVFSASVAAQGTVETSSASMAEDAQQIPLMLRAVITHGDLGDERYFAQKLGLEMRSSGVQKMWYWGQMCTQVRTDAEGEYFTNISTPWYYDNSRVFRTACGEFPYTKEFMKGGRTRVNAFIFLDEKKACITAENVASVMSNLKYSIGYYKPGYGYKFSGKNFIALVLIPSGMHDCIDIVNLLQNYDGDKK